MKHSTIVLLIILVTAVGLAGCTSVHTGQPISEPRTIDFQAIIDNAKSKVFPALVYVKPTLTDYSRGEKKKMLVIGSGVLISPDGYVVTNNHVVENAAEIKCTLFDKRLLNATLIGRDKDTDLALIKLIPEKEGEVFPYAEFADSDALTEGQFVMALGAPWGYSRSISLGIISNARRFLEGYSDYSLWIQTDASINPGNSGGPLINTDGKIVGINTLGILFGGDMAFSVPSNTVRKVIEHLKIHGEVKRSWTGLRIQALNDLTRETFFPSDRGVLVASVDRNSPAEGAGFRAGDLILTVNDRPLDGLFQTDLPAINWWLGELPLDVPSKFVIRRGDEELVLTLTPRDKGKLEGEDFDCERWDMTVKEINEFADPDLFFYKEKGIYVQGIQVPGNAASAGITERDIIISIDGQEIETIEDIKTLYENVMADETREKKLVVKVLRMGSERVTVLDYSFDHDKDK